jgi:transcription elongation factor SPT5
MDYGSIKLPKQL